MTWLDVLSVLVWIAVTCLALAGVLAAILLAWEIADRVRRRRSATGSGCACGRYRLRVRNGDWIHGTARCAPAAEELAP